MAAVELVEGVAHEIMCPPGSSFRPGAIASHDNRCECAQSVGAWASVRFACS